MIKNLKTAAFCTVLAGLALTTPAHFTPFQAGDGGWHMAAPAVGNIDSDDALEIVLAYRNRDAEWIVDAYDYTGVRLPGFPWNARNQPVNVSPTLEDVTGDGINEIIVTKGASVVALRGNGTVLWSHAVNVANYRPDAGFHFVTNGFYISGLPLQQPALPLTAEFFSEVSPPLVADIDADGANEVLTAWKINPDRLGLVQDYNPFINDIFGGTEWGLSGESWSGGVIVNDARTGALKFIYHFHQLVEAGLALAQLDDDPALEVLVLNDADGVVAFDMTEPHGLFGRGMLHKKFGKNLRLLSGAYQTGVDVHAADLDGDGLDEVLVPTTQYYPNWEPSENILDDDGSLLWREWLPRLEVANANGWFNNAALIPVNPDHDNRIDVLGFTQSHTVSFRTWDGVKLAPRPGWPKNFAPQVPTSPVMGDVDGDGHEEIIIGTYENNPSRGTLYVYALNGSQKFAVNIPSGVKHVPTIADLDRDGRTEVILRSLEGKVHILSFGNGSPDQVSWGTHRGNARRDGNYTRDLYPPGTPIVTSRTGGYKQASFAWHLPDGFNAHRIGIYRATSPEGPFVEVTSLGRSARSFTDTGLALGQRYLYEVAVEYPGRTVRSAPILIEPQLNNNLIVNGGFEQDDDSNWDKWFSGSIPMTGMTGSATEKRSGSSSLEIRLQNHGNNSTITQYSHYGVPGDYLPIEPGQLYSFGGFMRSTGLGAETRHWFEWDSSKTGENTNNRPPLPWPNYFTPPLIAGSQPTPWTYLNRVFEFPAGFPNAQLRHRFTTQGPATGSIFLDDIFFRTLPAPADAEWREWISFGSTWRYFTATPPANWFAESFNDSSWSQAPAKFGQGSGPHNIKTALPASKPAYYFRKQFVVGEGPWQEFLLSATCTDDYASQVYPLRIWINGTEIISGGIEAVSGEGNVLKYADLAPFLDLIRPGANTIAVMVNNVWQPTWDNVAFDISLKAIPLTGAAIGRIESIDRQANGSFRLEISASQPSEWRLESSDSTSPLDWRLVQLVTFPGASALSVTDSGQNQRLPPSLVPQRVYRLAKVD